MELRFLSLKNQKDPVWAETLFGLKQKHYRNVFN